MCTILQKKGTDMNNAPTPHKRGWPLVGFAEQLFFGVGGFSASSFLFIRWIAGCGHQHPMRSSLCPRTYRGPSCSQWPRIRSSASANKPQCQAPGFSGFFFKKTVTFARHGARKVLRGKRRLVARWKLHAFVRSERPFKTFPLRAHILPSPRKTCAH